MKRKRLDRDGWGFSHFPYVQMRVDMPGFRGWACVIRITSGQVCCWEMPRAGKVPVCGAGMTWLQLIPDGAHHVLTAKFLPDGRISVWYADVIDHLETDPDGVLAFVDAYLDVIFSPQGDVKVDDRDELDAAFAAGELTKEQHRQVLAEGKRIWKLYCRNLKATEEWCSRLLDAVTSYRSEEAVFQKNM